MILSAEQIAFRFLFRQKKRTILNILGVIMATALLTSAGTIIESVKQQLIENVINNRGYFHYRMDSLTPEQADIVSRHLYVDKSCRSVSTQYGILFETGDKGIPYRFLHIEQFDNQAMEMLKKDHLLIEGRLPETLDEIVIDEISVKILGEKGRVGETLALQTGFRRRSHDDSLITSSYYSNSEANIESGTSIEYFDSVEWKSYLISGIMRSSYYSSENYITRSFTLLEEDTQDVSAAVNIMVLLKEGLDFDRAIDTLVSDAGISDKQLIANDTLLVLTGKSSDDEVNSAIFGFHLIIVLIILVATIAVIYNSFNISLLERISLIGILRCTGASPASARRIILTEAAIISLVGIPFGIALGLGAMSIVFGIVDKLSSNILFEGIVLIVKPGVILSSCIICFLAVIFSALVPAIRAGKIPAMEAVRSTGMYSHDRKVKSGKPLMSSGHSFTFLMAGRNTQRNRKRFLATLFSMSVSVLLFVSFGGMLRLVKDLNFIKEKDYPGISLSCHSGIDPEIIAELEKYDSVKTLLQYREKIVTLKEGDYQFASTYRENVDGFSESKSPISLQSSRILSYGNDAISLFQKKLVKGNFTDPEKIVLVNHSLFRNYSGKRIYGSPLTVAVGDSVILEIDGKSHIFEIGGILDGVLYEDFNSIEGGIDFIVSGELFDRLSGNDPVKMIYFSLKPGSDKESLISRLDQICNTRIAYEYMDYQAVSDEMNRETSAISLFFYGFIIMIALIGSLNVVNTVSTNLLIRSRELGIIRAVGYGKTGIRKIIFLEGLILAISALMVGSTLGSGLWYLLVREMTSIRGIAFPVPWQEIGISGIALMFVIFLSSWYPLKRIFSQSALENIRFAE